MIRKATTADLTELSQVCTQSFLQSYQGKVADRPDEVLLAYVRENFSASVLAQEIASDQSAIWLAVINEKIVGYCKVGHKSPPACVQEVNLPCIERLYLLKEFHGQGLGIKLLTKAEEWAKSFRSQGLWLSVWEENKAAIKFYLNNGFTSVGHQFWEFDHKGVSYKDVDEVMLKLKL